jgi:6-phosphogluconolactonase
MNLKSNEIISFDDRRNLDIPGNYEATLKFCVEHFVETANKAIADHQYFAVALSGGNTPKAIYQKLASPDYRQAIDWSKVRLFWSDERCVPPTDPESNFHMAMEAGFAKLPLKTENIFRVPTEDDPEQAAKAYEELLRKKVPDGRFDLVMLGMGDDGHTASLFPKTHGLHTLNRLVIANFVPQKNSWRITFTFECINAARHIAVYVLGKSKAKMVKHVLTSPYDPDTLPVQRVGTPSNRALWILDKEAASELDV